MFNKVKLKTLHYITLHYVFTNICDVLSNCEIRMNATSGAAIRQTLHWMQRKYEAVYETNSERGSNTVHATNIESL